MDLMQMKHSNNNDIYNGGYYHFDSNHVESADIDFADLCGDNNNNNDNNNNARHSSNANPAKQIMTPNTRSTKQTMHSPKQTMTPTLEDILNENVTLCDEKLQFDFEEHILPPCFDSLINAETQMLASPDLNMLRLDSPGMVGMIKTEETVADSASNTQGVLKSTHGDLKGVQETNEVFQCLLDPSEPTYDEDLISFTTPEEMKSCQVAEEGGEKGRSSPPMTEKEIQLIKEVNKTLECILTVDPDDGEQDENEKSLLDFILPIKTEQSENEKVLEADLNAAENDFFESLQQVPSIEDNYNRSCGGTNLHSNGDTSFEHDFYSELPSGCYGDDDLTDICGTSLKRNCNKVPTNQYNNELYNKEAINGGDNKRVPVNCNRDLQHIRPKNSPNNNNTNNPTEYNKSIRNSCMKRRDISNAYNRIPSHKKITNNFNNRELPNVYNKAFPGNYCTDFSAGGAYGKNLTPCCYGNSLATVGHNNNNIATMYGEEYYDYYDKSLFNKTEADFIESSFFPGGDDRASLSFYDIIEEQVRHQRMKREEQPSMNRNVLDTYLPAEQDLIRRYIEGDKLHMPIPPFNKEIQEIIKRERKKHKNRVAASKCRKKKLEREAQLEVRVNCLKDRSVHLNTVVRDLRNQATTLKQRIMEHINAGCSLNPNLLPPGMNPYYV